MKAAAHWTASNFPLMVMALILASLAWFVALEQEDPTLEEPFSTSVPVTPSNLPEGMVIVGEFDESVQVAIRAPSSVFEDLTLDDFSARVDLAGLSVGTYEVPIDVDLDREPSRVTGFTPEVVTLELDSRAERSVPVRVDLQGDLALGYINSPPVRSQREVTAVGPSSYVTQVVEAFASVSIEGADDTIQRELRIEPRDAEGETVPYVTLATDVIEVRIPIRASGYYRSLAVKVVPEGDPASGYRVTDISVEPPTVTVFGEPNTLDALQGFIETKPIDIEGAQDDVVVRPALAVPEDVAVVPGQQVEVQVFIEPIQSSQTVEVTPEVQGLGPDLAAVVSPETVEVILSGPLPTLEALKADDVRVVLDLFDLSLGMHQLEPQVVVPEGLTAQSIIPATVQVEVVTASTPAPSGQGAITATATITTGQ